MNSSWLTRAVKWAAILAAIAALTWAVKAIDSNGYDRAESKYKVDISELNLSHGEEKRAFEQWAIRVYDEQSENVFGLSESLLAANNKIDAELRQQQKRKKDVSTLYRPQPTSALQPIPDWAVTNGWLCDYNRAVGYGVNEDGTDISRNAGPLCAADAFTASGVSAERILEHHQEYGTYCRKLENQIDALLGHIDFIEGKTE